MSYEAAYPTVVGLLSVALLISICINVIFCIKRRTSLCKDTDECWLTHICTTESPSENEGHTFHNFDAAEQRENPWLQDNPIYGNINSDRRDSADACRDTMTMQHAGDHTKKSSQADLNYASLNLKMAKKRGKKTRQQQSPAQGRGQDEAPSGAFPEAEADAHLPPRDGVLSHSSIYLNSQQIAQEAEEMERHWDDVGREGTMQREDGRSAQWKGERGSEERPRGGEGDGVKGVDGVACAQLTELEAFQSGRSFHR